jgi:hypothetical protein
MHMGIYSASHQQSSAKVYDYRPRESFDSFFVIANALFSDPYPSNIRALDAESPDP